MTRDEMLIKSGDVIGSSLRDAGDHKLGTIREVFLDRRTGQAKFAIIELSALFPTSGKFHPLPWHALSFDQKLDGYVTALTKDALKDSPAYDRDQLADVNYAWGEQTERYFDLQAPDLRPTNLPIRDSQ
jgi:hypothetical protein